MNYSVLIVFFALALTGKACGQSLDEIRSISFTTQTRGYHDEVVVSPDSVRGMVENHRVPEESRYYTADTDDDRWAELMLALKDVPLEAVDGLQSPTMDRAHDGAMHSSIVITFEDGSTVTHSFDGENPHPDLQPLLDILLDLRIPSAR